MATTTRRFLVPAYGADKGAVHKALSLLLSLCEQTHSPRQAILLIPTKQQITDGMILNEVLGSQISKALLQGKSVGLTKGCSLKLATMQTFQPYDQTAFILAVYGSSKLLKQMDNALGVEAIIVVPWTPVDVMEWQKVWNPTIIENQLPEDARELLTLQEAPAQSGLSATVIEGLKIVTALVNLSTGLSHSIDKPKAVALFRALKKSKEDFDPVAVKSWAVHNNWTPRGADQLAAVAQAVREGKRVQAPNAPNWGSDFVKKLREKAKASQS